MDKKTVEGLIGDVRKTFQELKSRIEAGLHPTPQVKEALDEHGAAVEKFHRALTPPDEAAEPKVE